MSKAHKFVMKQSLLLTVFLLQQQEKNIDVCDAHTQAIIDTSITIVFIVRVIFVHILKIYMASLVARHILFTVVARPFTWYNIRSIAYRRADIII